MAAKENHKWLDFGAGKQSLTSEWLKIMTQRETHVIRVYTSDGDDVPIGVVGLDDVNRPFKTARIWVVAGDKSLARQGNATRAMSKMLTHAFQELGLHAVSTWVVDGNPSLRMIERLGFRFIGRQRQCHYIDGCGYDRLWLDLLASEHKEV
jgi:RimJ/RimL family protein N-acetyltransferase